MTSHRFPPMMARHFDWEVFRANPPATLKADDVTELCSKTAVNPKTLQLALTLCNVYAIPEQGKDTIARAVKDSSIIQSSADAPKEDIRQLITNLASSGEGLSFLAVTSVVVTFFTPESIPKILSELARESGVPTDLAPTIEEWETLRPLYTNVHGPPAFSELVERYTGLYTPPTTPPTRPLKHEGPYSVVSFLYCLSLVTRDSAVEGQKNTERRGGGGIMNLAGSDAGWAAAVAEWLFGLKIRLRMGAPSRVPPDTVASEGLLYSNCAEGEKAQVTVCFAPAGVPVDGEPFVETPLEVRREWLSV